MKETNIWLSVIVPIYNAERYLRRCLQSIAAQSFCAFEVILVDDGSTDNSAEICREFCLLDDRFHCYRIANGGCFNARLFGTNHIIGEYFTFCDADDYYFSKDAFQLLFDKVGSRTDTISVVQFGFYKKYNHLKRPVRFVNEDIYVNAEDFSLSEYPKLLCSFYDRSRLSTNCWNKLYNRGLLKYLPTNQERVFWGEDEILNLHLLQRVEGALYLPDLLYVYQQSSGGTGKFSPHTMEDLDIIKKYQLEFLEKRSQSDVDSIRSILFSEIAGWFLYYIREARKQLSDQELENLITKVLRLPRFVLAKQYYLEHKDDWEAVELLRKSDVREYMEAVKKNNTKTVKAKLVQIAKYIYRHL